MIYKNEKDALQDIQLMEVLKQNHQEWMIDCLRMNPDFTDWGNGQAMMEYGNWWDGALDVEDVSELFALDELNELAHFYFYIEAPDDLKNTFISPVRLGVQLWILHPRKSTGRGMRLGTIDREEINEVISYLQEGEELIDDHFVGLEFI